MIRQLWTGILRAPSWRVLLPTVVVLAGLTGIAVAAIPSKINGVISSCYKTTKYMRGPSGQLRVIDAQAGAKCAKGERPLKFNQRGLAGKPGPSGPQGPAGPQGAPGAPGAPGPLPASYRAVNDMPYFVDNRAEPNTAVTLDLPAPGTYHVTGKVQVEIFGEPEIAKCELRVSGSNRVLDASVEGLVAMETSIVDFEEGEGRATMPVSGIITLGPGLGSPRTLRVDCTSSDEEGVGAYATLEAVSVAPPG